MATWQLASPPIIDMWTATGAVVGNKIYFAPSGNVDNENEQRKMQVFDTDNKTWTIAPDMLALTASPAFVSVGTNIFALGGRVYLPNGQQFFARTVQKFNTLTNSWSWVNSAPYNLYEGPSAAVVGNNIYYFGAWDLQSDIRHDFISVYNVVSDSWQILSTKVPTINGNHWGSMKCVSAEASIYCIGGFVNNLGETGLVYRFDTVNETWHQMPSMPTARDGAFADVYQGEIYVTGWFDNALDIYNINENLWRSGTAKPSFSMRPAQGGIVNSVLYLAPRRWGTLTSNTIYLDLRTASITNPAPTSGFVNEKNANTFSWTLESNPAGTAQQSATFQWRISGASTVNSVNIGSAQSVTIPANIFPDGAFEWRISATNTAGIVAPYTDWFLISTIDERPNKPTGLYPNSGSRDGTKTIQFSWLHNSPLSTPQSAFEVQISYDGGYSWRALSNKVTTTVTQFTAAANTILPTDQTGRVGWRVRTYNSDNLESPWSDTAFFIVHPAPQTPNWISVETGRARPLCRWTSLGQVGFQLQVTSGDTVIFDSGEIPGTAIEYRIPTFLPNGTFTFRLRIKNIRSLLSAWASRSVSINARRSLNITLQGEAVESGANLTFDVEVRAGG